MAFTYKDWVPTHCEKKVQSIATQIISLPSDAIFSAFKIWPNKIAFFTKKSALISIQQQML